MSEYVKHGDAFSIKLFKVKFLLMLGVALFSSSVNCQENFFILQPGYCERESVRCTQYSKSKDKFVSCASQFKDCISIKRIDDQNISFEAFSTQADQHICAIKGIAKKSDGVFVFYFGKAKNSQSLTFVGGAQGLLLKQFIPEGEDPENCGAHASFDGLKLKKIAEDPNLNVCFKG